MTCHMKSASFSATNQLVALFDGGPTKITQVFSTTSVSPTPAVYKKFKHSKNVSCYTEPRYSFIPNSIQKLEIFQTKRQSQIKSYLQQTFYFKPHRMGLPIIEWHSLTLQNITEMINYTMGYISLMLVVLHIKRFALYFARRSKKNICLLLNGTTMLNNIRNIRKKKKDLSGCIFGLHESLTRKHKK